MQPVYVEYFMPAFSGVTCLGPDAFAAASVKSAVLVLIHAVPFEVCHRSLGYQVESLTANLLCCIHTICSVFCLLSSTSVTQCLPYNVINQQYSDAKNIEFKKKDA